jgi:hypothetical protein
LRSMTAATIFWVKAERTDRKRLIRNAKIDTTPRIAKLEPLRAAAGLPLIVRWPFENRAKAGAGLPHCKSRGYGIGLVGVEAEVLDSVLDSGFAYQAIMR